MSRLRRGGALGVLALSLAFFVWLLFSSESAPQATPAQRGIDSAAEDPRRSDGLWVEEVSAPEGQTLPGESAKSVTRSDTPAAEEGVPEHPDEAPPRYGVRVRVLEDGVSARVGWPVVLLREDPRWRELAASSDGCAASKHFRNCGACHTDGREKAASASSGDDWNPRAVDGIFDVEPFVARGLTAAPDGEVFFPLDPSDRGRYFVRSESTPEAERQREVNPAAPPPLVDLVVSRLETVRLRVADDETWKLRPSVLTPWIDGHGAWIAASAETLTLRAGEELLYPIETTALLRFEAWIERPFAARLHLEPERTEHGRELVLDRRRHYVDATLQVLDAAGTPLAGGTLGAQIVEREPTQTALLQPDATGRVSFLLDAGAPPSGVRGLSLSIWPKPPQRIELPWQTEKPLLHPDRHEAHLDLGPAFAAGSKLDIGVVRLGEGPLLWSGRVVDGFGRAIPNAVVLLHGANETVPCDALGRFERRGFAYGPAQNLSAAAPGYTNLGLQSLVPPQREIELVLHRTAALSMSILGPPELAKHRVVLFAERLERGPEALDLLTDVRAESFDEQGRVRIQDLPTTELRLAIKIENLRVHELRVRLEPGENQLPPLDLGPLLRPLFFELGTRASADLTPRVRGSSASAELFDELFVIRAHEGTLQLWVPSACETWSVRLDGQSYAGRVSDAQPIVLR